MALSIPTYKDLIAKLYADANFRAQFLKDPTETLRAAGVGVPPGVTVKAVVDTRDVMHIVVPEMTELLDSNKTHKSERELIINATHTPTPGCHYRRLQWAVGDGDEEP
jgi:hypothetical protein